MSKQGEGERGLIRELETAMAVPPKKHPKN
jgi:hypothetical protein